MVDDLMERTKDGNLRSIIDHAPADSALSYQSAAEDAALCIRLFQVHFAASSGSCRVANEWGANVAGVKNSKSHVILAEVVTQSYGILPG